MNILEFSIIVFLCSYFAGMLGALTGLGGGVIVVPVLVLLFKIDIHHAMGASLIAVMATSSGAAMSFIKQHYTNLRIGMLLEAAAVIGGIIGALLLSIIPTQIVSILFGLILILSIWFSLKNIQDRIYTHPSHPWAIALKLKGKYPTAHGLTEYEVYNVPGGFILMIFAGALSGLLGIGSGSIKVLALDLLMGLPYKVSTSTSNFMIGMTATASIGIYFAAGYLNAELSFPVLLGILFGSFSGAKLLHTTKVPTLKIIFSVIVFFLALQMIYHGIYKL